MGIAILVAVSVSTVVSLANPYLHASIIGMIQLSRQIPDDLRDLNDVKPTVRTSFDSHTDPLGFDPSAILVDIYVDATKSSSVPAVVAAALSVDGTKTKFG